MLVHLPDISIRAINHRTQKYNTVGNYRREGDLHVIEVSRTKADYEFLVALHEFIEYYLVMKRGIALKKIDAFDIDFERKRAEGDGEPGDNPLAPYHKEHVFATIIEKLVAAELGVDWEEYGRRLDSLPIIES